MPFNFEDLTFDPTDDTYYQATLAVFEAFKAETAVTSTDDFAKFTAAAKLTEIYMLNATVAQEIVAVPIVPEIPPENS